MDQKTIIVLVLSLFALICLILIFRILQKSKLKSQVDDVVSTIYSLYFPLVVLLKIFNILYHNYNTLLPLIYSIPHTPVQQRSLCLQFQQIFSI